MKMRSCGLRMALAVVFLFGFATTCPAQEKSDWSPLDASINSSMKEWKVPGAAVTIVKDQSIVYMKGFGVREMGKSDPVTPDTLFQAASVSKAITAMARKLACLFYRLVKHGQQYVDKGTEYYEARYREQQVLALTKRAKKLGLQVVIPQVA